MSISEVLGAMPGPPANPNARRRNARTLLELPSEGRQGKPPAWPLAGQTDDEAAVWRDLWAMPQAVMWERYQWLRTVARYVRVVLAAEETLARDVMSEARQLEDKLGLTPKAMQSLMWKVADDELAERRAETSSTERPRRVLKAAKIGAVAGE